MILRPFSLKKIQKSISTLSPKGIKKPTYIRFKANKQKSSRGQRSLCSIDSYKQCNSLGSRKMLSHRKLISASSLQAKQNLTQRKYPQQTSRQRKKTVQSQKNLQTSRPIGNTQAYLIGKKRLHVNKFCRGDRLHTVQNEQTQHMEKVLEIKQNILKQFIDRFQQQLREISQQKSSRKTLLTNRIKTQNLKQQTTKKTRPMLSSVQSNKDTLNLSKIMKIQKQNIPQSSIQNMQKTKFEDYIKQIKQHKKKDQKIFIMKNHKKSLQNISISKIGQSQNITSRIPKIENKNKLNLKQLFKHSKKYQPYLKDSETICIKPARIQEIKQSNEQKGSLKQSPIIRKQTQQKDPSVYIDCSSIQKMNQSSFISEIGRKSILKHLQNQSIKIIKDQQKKSKKCLAKMKSIFPSDFF